ncbi:MAG: hypothetical protein M3259_08865 [Actinomycetota bacterium]|nr:hypothetical protein [Actinomycetota bacterium]
MQPESYFFWNPGTILFEIAIHRRSGYKRTDKVPLNVTGTKHLFSCLLVVLSIILLIGCSETSGTDQTDTSEGEKDVATQATAPESSVSQRDGAPSTPPSYSYTYGQASGNRATEGTGDLPNSTPVDVELGGEPAWVVGVPFEDDTAWVVTLEDGQVEAFRLDEEGSVRPLPVSPGQLAAGQPPAVAAEGKGLRLLASSGEGASTLTHPVPLSHDEGEGLLVVTEDGNLFVENAGGFVSVGSTQARALPDARAVRSQSGRIALLSDPTDRYAHGVIGDDFEAGSIIILEPSGESTELVGSILPGSGGVFELVSPLWFEGTSGEEELLAVTESAPDEGSRIALYEPGGRLVAAGPFMGQEQRWRHLLAAGPFGPNREVEIAAIRTPHIGGVVEFYAIDEDAYELEIVAAQPGYSSHEISSRNLDTARAGDLDGDGAFELLVPSQDRTELSAIRHGESGAEVAWTLPVGGVLTTNLATAAAPDGRVAVAAGRDGVLRIWP